VTGPFGALVNHGLVTSPGEIQGDKMARQYDYERVIQGWFAGAYGWEDLSSYEARSDGTAIDGKLVAHDLAEYRASGAGSYRVISRRVKAGGQDE